MKLFRYVLAINIMFFAIVACQAATIGDFVWDDVNKNGLQDGAESGVSGVTVKLFVAGTTNVMDTVVSGAGGVYQFSGVAVGSYQVGIVLPAYNTNVDYIVTLLDIGADDTLDNDLHAVTLKTRAFEIGTVGQTISDLDIGLSTPYNTISYALAEGTRNLFKHSSISNTWTLVGDTGRSAIEAIAYDPIHTTLYAMDADQLGSVDVTTAAFTSIGASMGLIDGSLGSYEIVDVDSLTYDPEIELLWGADRRTGGDILFQIDPATGLPVPDVFGAGVDYMVIPAVYDTALGYNVDDVDDMAIDPVNGDLYACANSGGNGGMLVILDKDTGEIQKVVGSLAVEDIEGMGFFNNGVLFASTGNNGPAGSNNRFFRVDKTDASLIELSPIDPSGANVDFESLDSYTGPKNLIDGVVYTDADEDGVYDSGEVLLAGITVELWFDVDNDGMIDSYVDRMVQTDLTDVLGEYEFAVYATDAYLTQVRTSTLPDGYIFTTDNVESEVFGGTAMIDPDNDFGVIADSGVSLSSVGNYVWLDRDRDGYQDPGEDGIAGVIITLSNVVSGVVLSTVTDSSGGYLFDQLVAGTYEVSVSEMNIEGNGVLVGMAQTTNAVLSGSDYGNQTQPYSVTVSDGDENLTADFGYNFDSEAAAIGNRVWNDADGDGVQDLNEVGIAGVTVNLYTDPDGNGIYDTLDSSAVTDVMGIYTFTNLNAGSYVVEIDSAELGSGGTLNGYSQTGDPDEFGQVATAPDHKTTQPIVLQTGEVFLNADFGYQPSGTTGVIGDAIWLDINLSGGSAQDAGEPGISGVTVSLIQDTNGDGIWVALGADGLPGTADDEPVIAVDTTDANGSYEFAGLSVDDGDGDADYLVWVNDTDNVLSDLGQTYDYDGVDSPDISAVALTAALPTRNDQDFSYGSRSGTIGDRIWADIDNSGGTETNSPGEPGIGDVSVELYLDRNGNGVIDAEDPLIETTITDDTGAYLFNHIGFGNYMVKVDTNTLPAAYSTVSTYERDGGVDSVVAVTLDSDTPDSLVQDFSYHAAGYNSVGDRIWNDLDGDGVQDAGEEGIAGVRVSLSTGAIATTDADGYYMFIGLTNGSYTVTVDTDSLPAEFVTTPTGDPDGDGDSESTVTLSGTDDRLRDFGYQPALGVIGDTVWFDSDNSGGSTRGTEPGIAGVTVNLIKDLDGDGVIDAGESVIATQTTDANGNYLFTDVSYLSDVTIASDDFSSGDYTGGSGWGSDWIETDVDGGGATGGDILVTGGFLRIWDDHNAIEREMDLSSYSGEEISLTFDVWQNTDTSGNNGMESDNWVDLQISTNGGTTWVSPQLNRFTAGLSSTPVEYSVDISAYVSANTRIRFATSDILSATEGIELDNLVVSYKGTSADYIVQVDTNSSSFNGLASTYDPDGGADSISAVTLSTNHISDLDQDFSYYNDAASTQYGTIGDTVWFDSDQSSNSVQGAEAGISNVTVYLIEDLNGDGVIDAGENVIATNVTDASGNYLFTGISTGGSVTSIVTAAADDFSSGDYTGGSGWNGDWIEQDGAGGGSAGGEVSISGGELLIRDNDGTPGNLAYRMVDLSAYSGETITLTFDYTAVSIAGSNERVLLQGTTDGGVSWITLYTFSAIADGSYSHTEDLSSYANANAGIRFVGDNALNATEGMNVDNILIEAEVITADPATYIVLVDTNSETLSGLDTTYDADGGLDHQSAVTLSSSSVVNLDQDFSYYGVESEYGVIGDFVWFDLNGDGVQDSGESGIEGVVVELYDTSTNLIATVETDENGDYMFGTLVPDATYIVRIGSTNFVSGGTLEGMQQTGDPDSTLDNQSTTDLSVNGPIDLTRDFGYQAPVSGTIGNLVFYDLYGDGIYNAGSGDSGVSGVTVDLYRDLDGNGLLDPGEPRLSTTTTDSGGIYSFTELPAGNYLVDVSDRDGVLIGSQHTRGTDNIDNNSQADPYAVALVSGGTDNTADFGYFVEKGSIGDFVWYDLNGDGVQDIGEPGITNVTLFLDFNNNGLPDVGEPTEVTDASGNYFFEGLTNGTYIVMVDTSTLPVGLVTNQTYDLDGVLNHQTTVSLAEGEEFVTADFGYDLHPTLVVVSGFRAETVNGEILVSWDIEIEVGTIGYYLERQTDTGWVRINNELISRVPFGNVEPPYSYSVVDPGVVSGETYTWQIVELDNQGRLLNYGPYTVTVDGADVSYESWSAGIDWNGKDSSLDGDADGDGFSNFEEYLAGTDPLDANSLLQITSIGMSDTGDVVVRWQSVSGAVYAVEISTDINGSWLPVTNGIFATPPVNVNTININVGASSPVQQMFFRVIGK